MGDLSAILIQNINPLVNLIRVPSKQIALMGDFEAKMEAIAKSTIGRNVTNLSGVPSWMLVLIKHILEKTGKQSLEEVWPNLEVFFHGGVAFTPYREQYQSIIRSPAHALRGDVQRLGRLLRHPKRPPPTPPCCS